MMAKSPTRRSWGWRTRSSRGLRRVCRRVVPPSGSATGSLAGSYPAPTLSTTGVTAATYGSATKVPSLTISAEGRVTAATEVSMTATGLFSIGATAPASPQVGQLWWRNDPDGRLFIYYNDGTSTQWVPVVTA